MSIVVLGFGLMTAAPALAADPNKPHPHQGLVRPYSGKPDAPKLTQDDLAALAGGQPVMKQIQDGAGAGRGLAVQDVNAPVDVVWARIIDYGAYPRMVESVKECGNYAVEGDHIKTRFVISAMMMNVEYFIDHTYKPDDGYLTWTLDYGRDSDLDDSVGFWLVQPIEDKPGWTRVFYSVEVKLRGWVPSVVETMIAKSGLPKATAWVKRESEAVAGTAAAP